VGAAFSAADICPETTAFIVLHRDAWKAPYAEITPDCLKSNCCSAEEYAASVFQHYKTQKGGSK